VEGCKQARPRRGRAEHAEVLTHALANDLEVDEVEVDAFWSFVRTEVGRFGRARCGTADGRAGLRRPTLGLHGDGAEEPLRQRLELQRLRSAGCPGGSGGGPGTNPSGNEPRPAPWSCRVRQNPTSVLTLAARLPVASTKPDRR
jgi:hypothetical protein